MRRNNDLGPITATDADDSKGQLAFACRRSYVVVVRRSSPPPQTQQGEVMQSANVIRVYETGLRGRPVARIRPGDLAEPYGKSPWQRVATLWSTIVDIVRETRELEKQLLGRSTYRNFG
jgi:hypothetical protein